ncbi:MAG: glycosyltransferase, partial [Chloroflexi bacterium]|nr:glycosyltransferase [Chloroflexota bacterium]
MVRVSIVMPVYNEADHIARSLRAIFAQTYPHDKIEVIIADGRSTDATRRIITDLMPEAGRLSLQLIDNPQRITAAGLNRALGHASGDVIIRVDGHCEIAPDYVSRCVAHLERGEADGVGGPIDTIAMTPAGLAIAAA